VKIAVCQLAIRYEQKEENLARGCDFIREASAKGAEMILFPEMSFTGFSMNTERTGEKIHAGSAYEAETVARMQNMAQKEQIAIGFGWVERGHHSSQAAFMAQNHYTMVNEEGMVIGDYIKIHPFGYAGENQYFMAGAQPCTFWYRGICFGITICYDLRFPELYQELSKQAHVILVPANWPESRSAHWKALLLARAIENQSYVIGVNCCGRQKELWYSGNTSLITPRGEIAFELQRGEELWICELSDDVEQVRKEFPVKMDRRPEIYRSFYM
jgi:predicted amidohydrolase